MSDAPQSITVAELAAWRLSARPHLLIDVREPWELEICRIADALSLPLREVPGRVQELPRDRPWVVFCHHGMRSAQAVGWLRRSGIADAVNLEGGIDAWAREVEPGMELY